MFRRLACLAVIIFSFQSLATVQAASPAGHWTFSEASGTTAYDSSGSGYNGTVYGGAVLNGSGLLTFDGNNDYVGLPIGTLIQSLNDCTFAIWVNFSNLGGNWQRIFDFGSSTSYYVFLCPRTGSSGPMRFAIKAGGGEQIVDSSTTLPSGLHCVVVRIDSVNRKATMFLDGAIVGTNTNVTLKPSSLGNTTNNWLGRSQYAADAYFRGSLDEFRIYNSALSDSEIQTISHIINPYSSNPAPANKLKTSNTNATLSWTPGEYVQPTGGHDLYFGTNSSDVTNATRASHPNVSYYNIDSNSRSMGTLASSSYYWRVDEVNGANIWKGDTWSFTVFQMMGVFSDNFDDPHEYLTEGVTGTGWDGLVGIGENETADALNASIDVPGQLYLESTNAVYTAPWQPLGPFLYKEVLGDFTAIVKVTGYQNVMHNTCGLMARASRDPDEGGSGEDWVSIDYFPIWDCGNYVRQADNGGRTEVCNNGLKWNLHPYLQLERVGNVFHFWTSPDGVNWTEMKCSPITRSDLSGLMLQIGMFQATYNTTTGYAAFDDFVLDYTYVPRPYARAPYPKDGATSVVLDTDLEWTAGDFVQPVNGHEVYFGTSLSDVTNATRASHPNVQYYLVTNPACDIGQLIFGQTYYWRVDEVNGANTWTGPVWSFTADTGKARNPGPRNSATGVTEKLREVRWTPSPYAASQSFYFSDSFNDVNSGTIPDLSLSGTDSNSGIPAEYLPLEYTKTYYWRVDTDNGALPAKKGDVWSFTAAAKPAYNDITFFVTTDLHYNLDPLGRENKWLVIDKMNNLPGTSYPAGVGGGAVKTPRGVLMTGDLTDGSSAAQWAEFTEDFAVNGEGRVYYPVYEGCGNHDGGPTTAVRQGIAARNLLRNNLTNISANGRHYSWDWDDVHFVCLNLYPGIGNGEPNNYGDNAWNTPEDSLTFLISDLAENVSDSGRPVLLYQHYGFDGFSTGWGWWTTLEMQRYYDAIKNYNVIGILWGHSHAVAISTWNGINVFNCGSIGSGFMVFHITPDENLVVAYRNKEDTWGASTKKAISIPSFCDYGDLQQFSQQWLMQGSGLKADFNNNGTVDFNDYCTLASYWFEYCPATWPW